MGIESKERRNQKGRSLRRPQGMRCSSARISSNSKVYECGPGVLVKKILAPHRSDAMGPGNLHCKEFCRHYLRVENYMRMGAA